jgi:hypothetical protein
MALQKTMEVNGVVLTDAYIKVRHISGNKNMLVASVEVYANKDIADMCAESNIGWMAVWNFPFVPNMSSNDNFITQAYNYVKANELFEGAIDV